MTQITEGCESKKDHSDKWTDLLQCHIYIIKERKRLARNLELCSQPIFADKIRLQIKQLQETQCSLKSLLNLYFLYMQSKQLHGDSAKTLVDIAWLPALYLEQYLKAIVTLNRLSNSMDQEQNQQQSQQQQQQNKYGSAQLSQLGILDYMDELLCNADDYWKTLSARKRLSIHYEEQYQFNTALKIRQGTLDICKMIYGDLNAETLAAKRELLLLMYQYQNKPEITSEIHGLYASLLETCDKNYGSSHIETVQSKKLYVYLLEKDRQQWTQAKNFRLGMIKEIKTAHGMLHSMCLMSMTDLALSYEFQKHRRLAENTYLEVVTFCESQFGPEDWRSILGMKKLSLYYERDGQWSAGEECRLEILENTEAAFGKEDFSTLSAMEHVAFTIERQKRWKDVIELCEGMIKIRSKLVGENSQAVLCDLFCLQYIYKQAKDFIGAGDVCWSIILKGGAGLRGAGGAADTRVLPWLIDQMARFCVECQVAGKVYEAKSSILDALHVAVELECCIDSSVIIQLVLGFASLKKGRKLHTTFESALNLYPR